jgi:hypothetical protein
MARGQSGAVEITTAEDKGLGLSGGSAVWARRKGAFVEAPFVMSGRTDQ